MKVSIAIGAPDSGKKRGFETVADYVVAAERLGADIVWTAEAWGQDAIVPLAYVAARTSRIRLATGIMQVTARAPVMTAMTALTMASVSGDRFILGLGNSGPQVVEGLHGVPFERPLERMREAVEIVRLAFAGEKIVHEGRHYPLPLPGGQGKALRLAQPANADIPIYLATLAPKALELTGAIADGWVGTSFVPENAGYYLDHLRRGAEGAGRSLADFEIDVGGPVAFTEDVAPLVAGRKRALAFQLGAMGSPTTNFYRDGFARSGFGDVAAEVQKLWVAKRRDEAAAAVSDELALKTSLFGTEEQVRERIRAYAAAGVTSLRLDPMGRSVQERLETLGRAVELVRSETA
jgi:F420-dependent oxidoreductase-like protein